MQGHVIALLVMGITAVAVDIIILGPLSLGSGVRLDATEHGECCRQALWSIAKLAGAMGEVF